MNGNDGQPHARPVTRTPGANAVVFGLKGSGKSSLVRSRLLPNHSRAVVVDPNREYGAVAVEVHSLEEWADYAEQAGASWRVALFWPGLEDDFEDICEAVWNVGNLLFVVEEADRFCDSSNIGDAFFRIVNYGRHTDAGTVDFLAVSRRPADVNRTLTAQAYEIYCFSVQEPRDVKYLRERVGEAFAEGLPDFPQGRYRYMDLQDRSRGPQDVVLFGPKMLDKTPPVGVD